MIPAVPDKKSVYLLTDAYAEKLERAGIGVRTYTAGFLHAKNIVVDGRYAVVSSYNLDFRSMFEQAECGALFDDRELAEKLERDFADCWRQGSPRKKRSAAMRALLRLATVFAPLT